MLVAWLVTGVAVAGVSRAEVVQQVPVREAVEAVDSPSADAAMGDAEARRPAGEAVSAPSAEQPPPEAQPPPAEQPPVER